MAECILVGNNGGEGVSYNPLNVDFASPIISNHGYGIEGIDEIYTASATNYILVFNNECMGQAQSTKYTSANITTTGTIIWTDTLSSDYSNAGTRDVTTTISLIRVELGDTVSLFNAHSNNMMTQTHLIFPVTAIGDGELIDISHAMVWDRNTTTETLGSFSHINIPNLVIKYIVCIQQSNPNNSGTSSVEITGVTSSNIYVSESNYDTLIIGEYSMDSNDTVNFVFSGVQQYVSKNYYVWLLK